MSEPEFQEPPAGGWLNRTVLGAGLTSLLADICYEMAAGVLPGFMAALHLPAAALVGILEGTADAVSNFTKLGAGWYSDRIGRRKPLVVFGYALTGVTQCLFALATGFPLIFAAKVAGWLGKGIRGPLRNAIMADAVAPADRGKAFGLHRAGDTIGAVLGPLIAFALLSAFPPSDADPTSTYRTIFWITLIPGIGAAFSFALLIRERPFRAHPEPKFWASLRGLPGEFKRFLGAVGLFGAGDCSDKLLLVAALMALGSAGKAEYAPLLYAWRNIAQALVSFPVGWLGDRVGSARVLVAGYGLGVLTMLGFALMFVTGTASWVILFGLFALTGSYIAVWEALESVVTADLVPDRTLRGTAYGVLGVVNGTGDLVASVTVGLLMQYVSPIAAFAVAAALMAGGTRMLGATVLRARNKK